MQRRFNSPWFKPQGLFIAEKDKKILGFHWTKIDDHPSATPSGEIYILAVDPSAGKQGIGSTLTQAGLNYFREHNMRHAELWVEADNTKALKVYQNQGFSIFKVNEAYHLP